MIAEVIVDISNNQVDRIFEYSAAEDVTEGSRVIVSFNNKKVEGYVIRIKDKADYEGELKSIISVIDRGLINEELMRLMLYMTAHYNLRFIDVLRLYIPSKLRGGKVKELVRKYAELKQGIDYESALGSLKKNATAQRAVLEHLKEKGDYLTNLAALYGSAVAALADKGYVTVSDTAVRRVPAGSEGKDSSHTLTAEQQRAVAEIVGERSCHGDGVVDTSELVSPRSVPPTPENLTAANGHGDGGSDTDSARRGSEIPFGQQYLRPRGRSGAFLLHGVTGSGKTEVYMRCIEHYTSRGRTAIMLVPEISLTAQVYRVFKARFGDNVAIIHSGLSDGERFDEYKRILNGEATVVIGARSAIFSPLVNIGIIIMDEEHDGSYISESNPRFDTETVAVFRAEYNNAALVLGSATPSVETYYKSQQGEYKLISMVSRVNERQMPVMEIIDMTREIRAGNTGIFSSRLQEALRFTVENKNQAMIYINRRGFASFVMCGQCGYVAKCGDCDVSLTYHSEDNLLKCHYCGKCYNMLTECPGCACKKIRYGRVGTEKVVGEIKRLLPHARVLRMDNDSTKQKDGHHKILNQFYNGEADILVGTQMISKGHDFPNVTLVGILDADMSLYFSDFRSSERTFQLITQVSGRAGREKKSGEVILQTFAPRHYVFRFAAGYDYQGFYSKEINSREVTKYPPFTKIVRVLVSSENEDAAMNQARKIYAGLREISIKERYAGSFVYLQAMKSPIKKIQSKYRYQILMRLASNQVTDEIVQGIYRVVDGCENKNSSVFVEINSQNLN